MSWEIFIPTALVAMVGVGVTLVLAARRSPYVRPWALLAAIALAAMPVAIVMHNLVSAIFGVEEAVFFIAALVIAPVGFALGTLGSGITLVQKGSRAIGASLVLGGAGMALFGLYSLVALVATTLAGGNLEWQRVVEPVVLSLSLLALVSGALSGLGFVIWGERGALVLKGS